MAQQQTDPMFGRAGWTYVNVIRGPVLGPAPRLAQGTGRTGNPASSGTAAQLPGYVSDNDYRPSPYTYAPTYRESFLDSIPQSNGSAQDGRDLVGTYKPHDFLVGRYFEHHMRRAHFWQQTAFGPGFRNSVAWQQVMRYRVNSMTQSARPLAANNYFLGYQVQSQIQGQIGQNTLGYMGSQ